MTDTNQINSLQDAAIVITAVFVSIFLVISLIWILKYYCCPTTSIDPTNSSNNMFTIYDVQLRTGSSNNGSNTNPPNPDSSSEHPIVPFSTKVRSIFLEKVLQHETFHPHKACHSDDIEKGIGTQSVTLTMHIENRTTATSITEGHNTELTTPTPMTEIVIQPGEDVKRTEDHIVDAVDVHHVPECETTDDLANFHIDETNSSDSNTMNDSCAICYETLEDGDDVTTSNCSKTFHRACIITWLMQHDTCPYCRNTFKNINDHKNIDAILGSDEKIIDCEE